ncbi:hypothetical protein llap_1669 [Limosa lapponica baueri]|uniref:Uncharacterized protein n=1 Tax=Limosa lapponica baueri TaxID=1758121 RepID=A0A2I0UPR4_LIMLA|nr:hypothetical protein llap_1669 [Limosa lapponica baueri]
MVGNESDADLKAKTPLEHNSENIIDTKGSLRKEPCGEDKGQWLQVAPGEVSSQYKKELFYNENNQSLEQPPQGRGKVPSTGGAQDVTEQGAR